MQSLLSIRFVALRGSERRTGVGRDEVWHFLTGTKHLDAFGLFPLVPGLNR